MISATFGWQGFAFDCPDDWGPAVLAGTRAEGYVRLSSAGSTELQVRWVPAGSRPKLDASLSRYIARLQADASKRKQPFRFETEDVEWGIGYRWTSERQARGVAMHRPECGRVFFLEITGGKKESLLPLVRSVAASFRSSAPSDPELWSLLGFGVRLPQAARLHRHLLQSGRIQLHWLAPKTTISAGRTSFGAEILGKMSLSEWARIGAGSGEVREDDQGVRIESSRRTITGTVRSLTLARQCRDSNELHYVNAMFRDEIWRPEWEWFAGC